MTRQFSAGGIVYKKEGETTKFLLIIPKPSVDFPKTRIGFPKGLIEKGESSEETVVREVKEETGVNARIIKKVGDSKIFFTFQGEKIFKVISYFLMEYSEGELVGQKEEIESVFWEEKDNVLNKLTYSSDKAIFKRALELLE